MRQPTLDPLLHESREAIRSGPLASVMELQLAVAHLMSDRGDTKAAVEELSNLAERAMSLGDDWPAARDHLGLLGLNGGAE